ncbi:MAG: dihydroorotate dehydrogenase, partial [Candidatus Wildermuthbacteria bacterium]|nr:dihydroorotate dehydrogenase [Candidatus Wildermuthbacteria bacterium]
MPGISVGGVLHEHPVMNAAGPRCKTEGEIQGLISSPVSGVMIGSITAMARPGNSGDV